MKIVRSGVRAKMIVKFFKTVHWNTTDKNPLVFANVCFAQRSCWAFSVAKKWTTHGLRVMAGIASPTWGPNSKRMHDARPRCTINRCQTWLSLIPARPGSAKQTDWSTALPIRLIPSRQPHGVPHFLLLPGAPQQIYHHLPCTHESGGWKDFFKHIHNRHRLRFVCRTSQTSLQPLRTLCHDDVESVRESCCVLGNFYWADVIEKRDAFSIFEKRVLVQIRNNIPYRWTPGTYDHRAWQTVLVCSAVFCT